MRKQGVSKQTFKAKYNCCQPYYCPVVQMYGIDKNFPYRGRKGPKRRCRGWGEGEEYE